MLFYLLCCKPSQENGTSASRSTADPKTPNGTSDTPNRTTDPSRKTQTPDFNPETHIICRDCDADFYEWARAKSPILNEHAKTTEINFKKNEKQY